jgi:hypothetical protein
MTTNLSRYRQDLESLLHIGKKLKADLLYEDRKEQGALNEKQKKLHEELGVSFYGEYQNWYTQSCAVIRQLIPDRLAEFQDLYKGSGKRKTVDRDTYNIQDWLNNYRSQLNVHGEKYFEDSSIVASRFAMQLKIVESVRTRFESSLHDILQLVQADLFDSEIDASRELLKSGFIRAAGVVAGVVLEKHLAQVASNHSMNSSKKNPTISDFNDLLKSGGVTDVPKWRSIQRLGDLRNLCGHSKDREPTKEEGLELIEGVDKLTKTLY